jgi:hypothetical protein
MSATAKPEAVEPPKPATTADLVRQLNALPTYAARKAFYEAHPELRRVIDPVNYQN